MTTAPFPSRRSAWLRLAAYTALLFASWNHNLLGIPDGVAWSRADPRAGYLGSESHLVVGRLARPESPAFYPLAGPTPDGGFVPYPSQVGLTGITLAAIRNRTDAPAAPFARAAGSVFALLTALVVAAVFAAAHRWLGPPAGDVACVLAASTPVFLPFAPSLYWAPFLSLAPFALAWCLDPWAATPGRKAVLLAGVGLAVCAKALCGYEYVTAVILAPVAAAWFHRHRAGDSPGRRFRGAAVLVGVGLLGFGAALAVHVGQQNVVFGRDGVAVIRDRAVSRTASDPQAEAAAAGGASDNRVSPLAFAAGCFFDYFDQRAISAAGGFGRVRTDVPLKVVAGLVLALVAASAVARRRLPRDAAALGGSVAVGLAASLSWQVLAVNHMCVHRHLNLIVFAVPFLPLAYLAAGYAVRLAAGDAIGRRVGPMLLAGVVAVMGVNVATDSQRKDADDADQRAAEAAVGARLGGAVAAATPGLGGALDTAKPAADVPTTLLMDYGRIDLATGHPADPRAVVLTGWAAGECKVTARPTTRVVVACGDSVVPCAVLRFRRPDVEALLGKPVAGTGFVAVVPSASLIQGDRVRVFVVSTADPTRLVELAVGR